MDKITKSLYKLDDELNKNKDKIQGSMDKLLEDNNREKEIIHKMHETIAEVVYKAIMDMEETCIRIGDENIDYGHIQETGYDHMYCRMTSEVRHKIKTVHSGRLKDLLMNIPKIEHGKKLYQKVIYTLASGAKDLMDKVLGKEKIDRFIDYSKIIKLLADKPGISISEIYYMRALISLAIIKGKIITVEVQPD